MCDCVEKVNNTLQPSNLELDTVALSNDIILPRLHTSPIVPREQVPHVIIPRFCPFCGEEYDEFNEEELGVATNGTT